MIVPNSSNIYQQVMGINVNEGRGNQSITQNLHAGIGGFRRQGLQQYTGNAHTVNAAIINAWTKAVSDRQSYYTQAGDMRLFWLVEAMINLIAMDVLNPDEKGKVIKVTVNDPEHQKDVDEFCKRHNLDVMLCDIIPDFIDLGEYFLRLKVKPGSGVTGIFDDVNQLGMVAMYEGGEPKRFLSWKDTDFEISPAYDYAHLVTGNNRMRVRLEVLTNGSLTSAGSASNTYGLPGNISNMGGVVQSSELENDVFDDLPDYIRIGRPIFMSVLSKLREMQLLEQLIPAAKINQITQSKLIGIKIPQSTPSHEAAAIVAHFQDVLNPHTGFNAETGSMTLAEVLNMTGKLQVIPQFMDDKGALASLDLRSDQNVDDILHNIKDIRMCILSAIGIPPSLVFGPNADGSDRSKSDEIRLHSQYARRVTDYRRAARQAVRHIIHTHLVNLNRKVDADDIDVSFVNALQDYSKLEQMEFEATEAASLNDYLAVMLQIFADPTLAQAADKRNFVDVIKQRFDALTTATGLSVFQDPDKVEFDVPQPGGGAGGSPVGDLSGDSAGGTSPGSVPLPSGVEGSGGGSAGAPSDIGSRVGQPAPGSGGVNVSNAT